MTPATLLVWSGAALWCVSAWLSRRERREAEKARMALELATAAHASVLVRVNALRNPTRN